jgi:hypothetical protein
MIKNKKIEIRRFYGQFLHLVTLKIEIFFITINYIIQKCNLWHKMNEWGQEIICASIEVP